MRESTVTNRKLLFILGPVVALVMFAGTVKVVSVFVNRSEYGALPDCSHDRRGRASSSGRDAGAGRRAEKAKATP